MAGEWLIAGDGCISDPCEVLANSYPNCPFVHLSGSVKLGTSAKVRIEANQVIGDPQYGCPQAAIGLPDEAAFAVGAVALIA